MRLLVVAGLVAALAASAGAPWREAQIGIPDTMPYIAGADQILFRPDNHHAYVAGWDFGYLQILDYTTRAKVRRIETSQYVWGIVNCVGQNRLYLLETYGRLLTLDDDDSILGVDSLPANVRTGIYNPVVQHAYIGTDYGGVYVIDPGPDTLCAVIGVDDELVRAELDSTGNRAFFMGAEYTGEALYVIDCETDSFLGQLPTPEDNSVDIEFDPVTRQVYFLGVTGAGPEIWVYNADSLTLVDTIALPEHWTDIEGDLVIDPEAGFLYAHWGFGQTGRELDWAGDSIAVIKTADNTLYGYVTLPEESNIRELTVNEQDHKLYATFWDYDSVAVIRSPDTVAAWIALDTSAHCAALCPATGEVLIPANDNLLYFASGSSDSIAAQLDYRQFRIDGLAWVPGGDKLYAALRGGIATVNSHDQVQMIICDDRLVAAKPAYAPGLNRLYLVPGFRNTMWVFDCSTDSIVSVESLPVRTSASEPPFAVPNQHKLYVPSASANVMVYDTYLDSVVDIKEGLGLRFCSSPRTGRVYGALNWNALAVIDPASDSVVDTITPCLTQNVVESTTDNVLYTTDNWQSSHQVYVVDLEANSVIDTIFLPGHPNRLAWYEPLNKLYALTDSLVVAIDCRTRTAVRAMPLLSHNRDANMVFSYRNDRLWVAQPTGVIVVQCRVDSLIASFPGTNYYYYSNMVWNPIDNRVYTTDGQVISVFRDDMIGVEEADPTTAGGQFRLLANPAHGSARFIRPQQAQGTFTVRDVAGRLVWQTQLAPGRNDLTWPGTDLTGSRVPSGIYFAALDQGHAGSALKVVLR